MILSSSIKSDQALHSINRKQSGSHILAEYQSLWSRTQLMDTSIESREKGLGAVIASSTSSAVQLNNVDDVPCDEGIQRFNWVTAKTKPGHCFTRRSGALKCKLQLIRPISSYFKPVELQPSILMESPTSTTCETSNTFGMSQASGPGSPARLLLKSGTGSVFKSPRWHCILSESHGTHLQGPTSSNESQARINLKEPQCSVAESSRQLVNWNDSEERVTTERHPQSLSVYQPGTILQSCSQKHDKLSFSAYKSNLRTFTQSNRVFQPLTSILSKKASDSPRTPEERQRRFACQSQKRVRFSSKNFVLVFERQSASPT